MKSSLIDSDELLIEKAVAVLFDKLGPIDATRFLALPKKKRMESVKRHRLWQAQLNEKDFLAEVFGPNAIKFVKKT